MCTLTFTFLENFVLRKIPPRKTHDMSLRLQKFKLFWGSIYWGEFSVYALNVQSLPPPKVIPLPVHVLICYNTFNRIRSLKKTVSIVFQLQTTRSCITLVFLAYLICINGTSFLKIKARLLNNIVNVLLFRVFIFNNSF